MDVYVGRHELHPARVCPGEELGRRRFDCNGHSLFQFANDDPTYWTIHIERLGKNSVSEFTNRCWLCGCSSPNPTNPREPLARRFQQFTPTSSKSQGVRAATLQVPKLFTHLPFYGVKVLAD
jgi:hypothetical protein